MIEVKLGGKTRQLDTRMGALRKIKEITGKDPFKWVSGLGGDSVDSLDAIEVCILAGLSAYADAKKTEAPNVDEVREWINALEPKEALAILTDFTNTTFGVSKEPGEVKTPMHK